MKVRKKSEAMEVNKVMERKFLESPQIPGFRASDEEDEGLGCMEKALVQYLRKNYMHWG